PPPRPPQSTIPQLTSLLINNAGALPAVRIGRVRLRGAKEHERFAAHLIDGVAFGPFQAFGVRHRRGDPMDVVNPCGPISHSGQRTDSGRSARRDRDGGGGRTLAAE
ncbi:hypothetical protein OSI58_16525, partial [Mycobacterium ulcerans]|nr:hypothetical protein [Mycobacterium ulcerans]MEB4418378.1 hypothetical protein [Mycobacterium ulcerans]